ncbi:MAG: ribonuclease III [Candidatus Atribacteria bacterium]|nr:ribonuclease III [Candidatus Atribacteria bacterium]
MGYHFKSDDFLGKALTHSSCYHKKEEKDSNYFQRLEFLGDSVFNLSVSEYLYKKFPFFSEGKLSKLKSVIISQTYLVKFAEYIHLNKYIILGKSVDLVRERGKFSILADCMEACIGAIYLDSGFISSRKVVYGLIDNVCKDLINEKTIQDYKTLLQEKTQRQFNCLPDYRLTKEEGMEHQKVFYIEVIIDKKVYGKGSGKNKKEAEQAAACEALDKILKQ